MFVISFASVALGFTAFGDTLTQVNQIVAFGDSLTDTGNASIATLGVQPGAGYAYRTVQGCPLRAEFTESAHGNWSIRLMDRPVCRQGRAARPRAGVGRRD